MIEFYNSIIEFYNYIIEFYIYIKEGGGTLSLLITGSTEAPRRSPPSPTLEDTFGFKHIKS